MNRVLGDTLTEKLQFNVSVDGSCLRWTRAHSRTGYGRLCHEGKPQEVHRLAHEAFIGPIPEGHDVDHVWARGCRYRDCINPSHLEAVTHAENIDRLQDRSVIPQEEKSALIRAWTKHVQATRSETAA